MGTNYYWHNEVPPCPTCGHNASTVIHIGKSSIGWEFHFHGTEEIRSWKDWKDLVSRKGRIVDEYGRVISPADFADIVESCYGQNHFDYSQAKYAGDSYYLATLWKDSEGYSFSFGEFS